MGGVAQTSELEQLAALLMLSSKETLVTQLLRADIRAQAANETIGMLEAEVAWLRKRKETR